MKKAVIRGLYGVFDKSHRITNRRFRISRNIHDVLNAKHKIPFETYVFGEENYNELTALGVKAKLVDKNPAPFDLVKHQYRNKIELIRYAMQDYDEIVFMDWDVSMQFDINLDDFWKTLNQKETIQACLQQYRRRKCHWRKEDQRKVPNGGFIYLRDNKLPDLAADWWEKIGEPDTDETAWARITDEMVGGWKGIDLFWDKFEIPFCNLKRMSAFTQAQVASKNAPFVHDAGGR